MRVAIAVTLALVLVGCSKGGDTKSPTDSQKIGDSMVGGSPSSAPKTTVKESFGDDVFKVPVYTGAEMVQYSSIEMQATKGHTYARHYTTADPLDKVEEFIKTEGAKFGKMGDPLPGIFNKDLIRNGSIALTDGGQFVYKLTKMPKDGKTDIMYNVTLPGK